MNKIFKTYCTTISALASFQVKAIYFNGRDFRPSKATYSSMILGSRYGETYARRMVRLVLPPMQIGKETRNTAGQGKALPNAERPVTLPTSRGNARHRRGSRSALLSQSLTSRSSRKSLAGQGKALPNAERPVTLPTSRGNAPSTGSRSALPQPPPIHTLSVKPPTSGKERKGVAWRRSADPYFVDAPPSSEIWEKATGARALLTQIRDVAAVSRFTSQEMAEIALRKSDFLAATAVLGDQAPMGSPEKNFADLVMRSVKRGILESLPAAMAELEKFSRKSEFQGRQLDWVKFLAGATVQCFSYPNCQAFCEDSDANLESKHDYVQVVFPSWHPSRHANQDLYIRDNEETWKALVSECPTVRRNINLNIQLNAIRMLHFWGFKFAFVRDTPDPKWNRWKIDRVFVNLEDNPGSPLHSGTDHNTLRATRFIETLEMFGCFNGLLKIFAEGLLPEYYSQHPSWQYWHKAWENTPRLF